MSTEEDKERHQRRIQQKERHIARQMKIRRAFGLGSFGFLKSKYDQPHRYHKMSGVNCGNPDCVMCGNPRKVWKEETLQEKREFQPKNLEY